MLSIPAAFRFRLIGQERSGHHAVGHWIMRQCPPIGLLLAHILDDRKDWKADWIWYYDDGYYQPQLPHDTACSIVGYNWEQLPINRQRHVEVPMPTILVVRDLYNLLASKMRKKIRHNAQIFEQWAHEIRLAQNPEHWPHAGPLIPVNFNRWFSERAYRHELAQQLTEWQFPLTFTDRGINEMLHNGGGSSFSGLAHKNTAQELDVLSRYREVIKNPPRYLTKEMKDLNAQYFGDIYS